MHDAFIYLNVTSAFILMIGMAFLLARLFGGPSLYDRALAVNSFGTKIVLFLCMFSLITGRMDGVDIAILYALMNFIATIAILKFFRYRGLTVSLDDMFVESSQMPSPKPIKAQPKPAAKTTAAKVVAPKKSTAKKTTLKKPVVKKITAKKPVAKKPVTKTSLVKKAAPKKASAKKASAQKALSKASATKKKPTATSKKKGA